MPFPPGPRYRQQKPAPEQPFRLPWFLRVPVRAYIPRSAAPAFPLRPGQSRGWAPFSPRPHRSGPDDRTALDPAPGRPAFPLIPPYPGHCAPYNSPLTGRPGQTAPEALSGLPDPPGSRTVRGSGTYPHISGKCSPHRPYTGDSSSFPRSLRSRPLPPGSPAEDPGYKDP